MTWEHVVGHKVGTLARGGVLVLVLALATLTSLYVFEAGPARGTTNTAYAWQCSLKSNMTTGDDGKPVTTLSWSSSNDVSYITFDQFPDQTFGPSGTLEVHPEDSTTYTARTHIDGSNSTMWCKVTVQVEQPPATTCDATTLTLDGTSFTWKSCGALKEYEATFCDGTDSGVVKGDTWSNDQTLDLGKCIKTLRAKSDTCEKTASQTCPEPPEEPQPPVCPFTASDDTTVVSFGSRLVSNGAADDARTADASVTLPAGTYTVKTASWDGYTGREDVSAPDEVWRVVFLADGSKVAQSGLTTDLPDGTGDARAIDTVSTGLVLSTEVNAVFAAHGAYPDTSSANSVWPVCASFTKHPATPPVSAPSCTMNLSGTSVSAGESATLTWTSASATTAVLNAGIGTTTLSGTQLVSPIDSTTYTGVFTDDAGHTATCSATLTVTSSGGGGGGGSSTPTTPVGGGACLNCDTGTVITTTPSSGGGGGGGTTVTTPSPAPKTPTIVLSKVLRQGPIAAVSLAQVPYTGFEAGPIATMFFWLGVLLISALIAYVVTKVQPLARLRAAVGHAVAARTVVRATTMPADYSLYVAEPTPDVSLLTRQQVPGALPANDGVGKLEELAHEHNILLSPEAIRTIADAIERSGLGTDGYTPRLFELAVATYPREDGWILLTFERAQVLTGRLADRLRDDAGAAPRSTAQESAGRNVSSSHDERPHRIATPSMTNGSGNSAAEAVQSQRHVAPGARRAPASATVDGAGERTAGYPGGAGTVEATKVEAMVPLFIDVLVAGEQKKAFDLLRRLHTQESAAETFIATVVRNLDDVYKNRLEGNHDPDEALAGKTALWSNYDFEKVLGALVECIDYSYSNNRVGTKIALAKVFEHFAKKQA